MLLVYRSTRLHLSKFVFIIDSLRPWLFWNTLLSSRGYIGKLQRWPTRVKEYHILCIHSITYLCAFLRLSAHVLYFPRVLYVKCLSICICKWLECRWGPALSTGVQQHQQQQPSASQLINNVQDEWRAFSSSSSSSFPSPSLLPCLALVSGSDGGRQDRHSAVPRNVQGFHQNIRWADSTELQWGLWPSAWHSYW